MWGQKMLVQLSKHSFIRHYGAMTAAVNQRNGAAYFLKNAKLFLAVIERKARPIDEMVSFLVAQYPGAAAEIKKDFLAFIESIPDIVLVGDVENELRQKEFDYIYTEMHEDDFPSDRSLDSVSDDAGQDAYDAIQDYTSSHKILESLHLDLTPACNERCVHCYIPEHRKHFIASADVRRILDEFRDVGGLYLTLSGGEPMLHPDFCDIVDYARRNDLMIYILSNLTLLDEEKADRIARADIHYLQTSVYSMDGKVHDRITRCPGSFEKTMRGIELLRKYHVPVKINTPVLTENFSTWESVRDFAYAANYKFMSNASLTGQGNHDNLNLIHALSPSQMAAYLKNCRDSDGWGKNPRQHPNSAICSVCRRTINIDAFGDFYPCDGCHSVILGNISRMSMREVWNADPVKKLRAMKERHFSRCVKCADREFCKVCPAANFSETGDFFSPLPSRCALAGLKHEIYRSNEGEKKTC